MSFLGAFGEIFNPVVSGVVDAAEGHPGEGLQVGLESGLKNFGGMLSGSSPDLSAQDELANLYKQQWSNYLQQYAPQENLQLGMISDAGNALERQQAVSAAAAPFSNGQGDAQLKRQALAYGTKISPAQMKSFNQSQNLQSGLSQVGAYNNTQNAQTDRAFGVIGQGGTPTPASISNPVSLIPGG